MDARAPRRSMRVFCPWFDSRLHHGFRHAAAERFYDAIMKRSTSSRSAAATTGSAMASGRVRTIRTGSISPSARARSPKKRSAATGASRRGGGRRSTRSGTLALQPAAPTTGAPGLRDYHASYYAAFLQGPRRQPDRGGLPSSGLARSRPICIIPVRCASWKQDRHLRSLAGFAVEAKAAPRADPSRRCRRCGGRGLCIPDAASS